MLLAEAGRDGRSPMQRQRRPTVGVDAEQGDLPERNDPRQVPLQPHPSSPEHRTQVLISQRRLVERLEQRVDVPGSADVLARAPASYWVVFAWSDDCSRSIGRSGLTGRPPVAAPTSKVWPALPNEQGLWALPPGHGRDHPGVMSANARQLLDRSMRPALAEVISTRAALRRARESQATLAEVRAAFLATESALDTAIGAATALSAHGLPLARELRKARALLILQRQDTDGMNVPDCAQTASLDADGPHTPGLEFEWVDPHGPGTAHMHGLDLTAALEPLTRATAGQPGPHSTHRRRPAARWIEEK